MYVLLFTLIKARDSFANYVAAKAFNLPEPFGAETEEQKLRRLGFARRQHRNIDSAIAT